MSEAAKLPKLDFRASRRLPRRLSVELSATARLYAYAWGSGKRYIALAGANQRIGDVLLLAYGSDTHSLAVGDAQFPVLPSESAEIERVCAPLGLRVLRERPGQ